MERDPSESLWKNMSDLTFNQQKFVDIAAKFKKYC
jgi:hypothetical protein